MATQDRYSYLILCLTFFAFSCWAQIIFPGGSKKPQVGSRTSQCPAGQLKFANGCHPEWTRGAPCPENQWLTKADGSATDGKCSLKPCPGNQLLWTIPGNPTRVCASASFGIDKCPEVRPNHVSVTDKVRGTGQCDCSAGLVFWPADDRCYQLYSRGPCPEGQILVYDPLAKFISCQTNPCDAELNVLWNDGVCYALSTTGPCTGENEGIVVSTTDLVPICEPLVLKQLINVQSKCSAGTRRDFNGNCSQTTFFLPSMGVGGACEKGFIRKPDGTCAKWF
ncbi:unnamed protein product [Notodromas monacha]|uniref:DUF4789 domain-containing protein n=1 Tax=Notodromas monacha TaxID=399045 RepID=A0A7R9C320_9CRUS|nr:unnamed protein product [Notodromas monacha]CAG0924858.1 unnamed protein product [Notodromas monacha]